MSARRSALPLFLFPLALVAARSPDAAPLRNLNAGTQLAVVGPIQIAPNSGEAQLSRPSTDVSCILRPKQVEPFGREVPPGKALTVKSVQRWGVSSRARNSSWTSITLDSPQLADITCEKAHGRAEMTIQDFESAVAPVLKVESSPAYKEID